MQGPFRAGRNATVSTDQEADVEEDRSQTPPRIERLRVENYRALKQVELKEITPLTVLLGPNGSGKSTLFDAFSFLSDCFQQGLRAAWDRVPRV